MTGRPVVLTGDRPNGPLHLGHFAGSLANRLRLQEQGHQIYVLIADLQMLSDRPQLAPELPALVEQVMLDYLSIGLNPDKVNFVLQSSVPQLSELTGLLGNLISVAQLQQNPTVKNEIRERGLQSSLPLAFFTYPISQSADILGFKATIVPVGSDQLPMIETAKDLGRKFNSLYGEVFPEPTALLSSSPRLPGLEGMAKASKSLGNAIYLKDSPEEVHQKIRQMYTDPLHLRVDDPGHIEGNVVFAYLKAFDPDSEGLREMEEHYQRGGLGDAIVKDRLCKVLDELMAPMHKRRQVYTGKKSELKEILRQGTETARNSVETTMKEVRSAMRLDQILA